MKRNFDMINSVLKYKTYIFGVPVNAEVRVGLTKREMAKFSDVYREKYTVWVKSCSTGLWRIEIHFDGQDCVYEIETLKGFTKSWRILSEAISFAQETCKHYKSIFVEVAGVVLTKGMA